MSEAETQFQPGQKVRMWIKHPKYWVNPKTGEKRLRDKGQTIEMIFCKYISPRIATVWLERQGYKAHRNVRVSRLEAI